MHKRFTRSHAASEATLVALREDVSESSHDGASSQAASDQSALEAARVAAKEFTCYFVHQTRPVQGVEPTDDHAALLEELRCYCERFRAPMPNKTVVGGVRHGGEEPRGSPRATEVGGVGHQRRSKRDLVGGNSPYEEQRFGSV
ncbi:unnamed protein product [Cochlearia groenlandica]